jgi:hypothetical protein
LSFARGFLRSSLLDPCETPCLGDCYALSLQELGSGNVAVGS